MIRISFIIAIVAFSLIAITGAASQVASVPAPVNVEMISRGQDFIQLGWGPSLPGEAYAISNTKTSLTIGWGVSQDARSSVTYTVTRDGQQIGTGIAGNAYRITGLKPRTGSFRTCITAQNANNQSSPPMCTTWTRN